MNPSLEQYSICPAYDDEIKYANYWMSLDSSFSPPDWTHDLSGVPEYCNICDVGGEFGVPTGLAYTHYPHTGVGMAQVQMFYNDVDTTMSYKRDYLQGHLSQTLIAGQSYCVTFYVTLEQASLWAINHIGAYLDDGTIDTTLHPDLPQTQFTPQILETTIINDSLDWVKIQGSFIANGTERIITIGNFFDKGHTLYAPALGKDTTGSYTGYSFSWYLVDDVSIIKSETQADAGSDKTITLGDSALIGTTDGYLPTYWYANGTLIDSNTAGFYVHPTNTTTYVMSLDVCGNISYDTVVVYVNPLGLNNLQAAIGDANIYPNPAYSECTISYSGTLYNKANVAIYDVTGRLMHIWPLTGSNTTISIAALPPGIYQCHIDAAGMGVVSKKLVVMR